MSIENIVFHRFRKYKKITQFFHYAQFNYHRPSTVSVISVSPQAFLTKVYHGRSFPQKHLISFNYAHCCVMVNVVTLTSTLAPVHHAESQSAAANDITQIRAEAFAKFGAVSICTLTFVVFYCAYFCTSILCSSFLVSVLFHKL